MVSLYTQGDTSHFADSLLIHVQLASESANMWLLFCHFRNTYLVSLLVSSLVNRTRNWPMVSTDITSCVCSAASEAESTLSNVRRENKLYSYKEQMADIELRRVSCSSRLVVVVVD